MEQFIKISFGGHEPKVRNKGKSLNEFPKNFCVLDLETTGLDSQIDEIIEIGILKVIDCKVVDIYHSLIKPESAYINDNGEKYYVDDFIENLTGITNEMLKGAPLLKDIYQDIEIFIGDDPIVGHNVNFDINFLYDFVEENYQMEFKNDYWDLMKLSRRILKDLKHHRLKDLAKFFNYNYVPHRSIDDCKATYEIMQLLKFYAEDNNIDYLTLKEHKGLNLKNIQCTVKEIDVNNYFYGKNICFTGKLEHFERKDAAQICVNLGAICQNSVTKKTDILVLGNFDYNVTVKDKSSKLKKAEKLILDGQDLLIMNENSFLDVINSDN